MRDVRDQDPLGLVRHQRAGNPGLVAQVLGRDEYSVCGPEARLLVEDQTVLITGAGGSIGSDIVRQVASLGARKIICVDRDEYALYRLQLEFTDAALLIDDTLVLADVQSRVQVDAVFAAHQPQLVFHAAACKQLPLLERSVAQAVLTNVLGTVNVAAASAAHGVRRFVNISTDKAARPISVLGMTKRLAEMAAVRQGTTVTRVASVRFGNVFASRGSFIETLAWQIAKGRPVTVTHPAMTRYFMTVRQAVGLVIEAAVMADGQSTYVLDMGESHRIVDVARRYATLAGHSELQIDYTGRRPGEKLGEELADPCELPRPTNHPLITAIPVTGAGSATMDAIGMLCDAAAAGGSADELRDHMSALLAAEPAPVAVLDG
jgi:FlaA1/EpsC-like NDP-sugar epimerase